jgi:hypothetical protein
LAWQSDGDYAITDGKHWIAKLLVHGQPGYLLWLHGRLVTGTSFKTSSAAARYAREHENDSTPGCD